jgi:hypothetical protein
MSLLWLYCFKRYNIEARLTKHRCCNRQTWFILLSDGNTITAGVTKSHSFFTINIFDILDIVVTFVALQRHTC